MIFRVYADGATSIAVTGSCTTNNDVTATGDIYAV
jgi:hypothetical protein